MEQFDKNAVLTIQGGGVYALTLLGQLEGVVKDNNIVPLALAGTSAGAIVASLFWSKLDDVRRRPQLIRDEIADLCPLTDLVGPYEKVDGKQFDFPAFNSLLTDCRRLLERIRSIENSKWLFKPFRSHSALKLGKTVRERLTHFWAARGLFSGNKLEEEVERILRKSPEIARLGLREEERVTFQHYREVAQQDPNCIRPPLFLVATNLSTKTVAVFSSIDDRCRNISVARAVRASAGFPVFFRPIEVNGAFRPGWYVDGGVVSNFPSWVFAEQFRMNMGSSEAFRGLAMRHWIHIGLRVEDDAYESPENLARPFEFMGAIASMLTGYARNELDDKLAESLPRSFIVRQPQRETGGPKNVLAFDQINDRKVVSEMYMKGSEFAERAIGKLNFSLPRGDAENSIEEHLRRLIGQIETILGSPSKLKIRSNIFIPSGKRLCLCYAVNMSGDKDEEMVFSTTASGLTGACYTGRCSLMCNLEEVAKLHGKNAVDPAKLFNMTKEEQDTVSKDRTWLASTPIFDPFDSSYRATQRASMQDVSGVWFYQMNRVQDGAILGVLNIDTDWSYSKLEIDPDPNSHCRDPRVIMIMDFMQQSALRIGNTLGTAFARRGD